MDKDLFTFHGDQILTHSSPLADRLRPTTLDEFIGQGNILAEGRLLRRAIAADRVGNLIFYGPPGVGKTTLARIIALNTRSHFSSINAVLSGVKEIRESVEEARQRLDQHSLRTILFIDEVHRFNTTQQDALLPWIENGTLILIGATTENPYFEVNKALLSRSTLFRLQSLENKDLSILLNRAMKDSDKGYGNKKIILTKEAENHLIDMANGDARSLLNALELAVETTISDDNDLITINLEIAEQSIQERALLYDKLGDAHFDTISAFIKSIRGSDPDASLFWLARMLEGGEKPSFIFRRLLIAAAEDIGLADPQAIVVVEACAAAFERVGLPEGFYPLAQATLYLANTDKSNSVKGFFEALESVKKFKSDEIPSHLRDAHRDHEGFGDGKGYLYPHNFPENWVVQQYLPPTIRNQVFWKPGNQGWESQFKLINKERKAAQMAVLYESNYSVSFDCSYSPLQSSLHTWVERNLQNQGQRLRNLMRRLWSDILWKRNDRVLIVEAKNLFWSLIPIEKVPEGGVTILSPSKTDKNRLSEEINLLDLSVRPTVLEQDAESINKLPDDLQFEWIGGRINISNYNIEEQEELWKTITKKSGLGTGLRLLFSHSILGPAEAIKSKIPPGRKIDFDIDLLDQIILLEKQWLYNYSQADNLRILLESLGWICDWEYWEESLSINISQDLIDRWLNSESIYLKIIDNSNLNLRIDLLRNLFEGFKGKNLPQKILHRKLSAQLSI